MTDYTGTGQNEKKDIILTNIRCLNPRCNISLSPTKSEYENSNYHCYNCQTAQHGLWYDCGHVHKNIEEALNCKKQETHTPHGSSPAKPGGAVSLQPNPKDKIGITKLPLHLIPAPALARLSKVMELGAQKYGPYNWRESEVNLTVYIAAALRHLYSVLDGQDIDEEEGGSGQHHITHVMACCAIILDAIEINKLIDDRPPKGNFAHLVHQLQEKKENSK